jgi:DNA-binding NarL/FixJ family response regulator
MGGPKRALPRLIKPCFIVGDMPITIAIVEDHAGMRESLATLFNNTQGIRCVDTYRSGETAVKQIWLARPDVALVDINLPGMSGIECVTKLKEQLPKLQILMLTMYEQTDLIFNSLRAGASGYLLKNTPSAELIQAIEEVHAGGAPMTMQIARKVAKHFQQGKQAESGMEKLTKREQEILSLVVQGLLNQEVAERMNLTPSTVRANLQVIYEKLRVQSRTQAVVKFPGGDSPTAEVDAAW